VTPVATSPRGGSATFCPPVSVCGQQLSWVQAFRYLGSTFASSGTLSAELACRFQAAANGPATACHQPTRPRAALPHHGHVCAFVRMRVVGALAPAARRPGSFPPLPPPHDTGGAASTRCQHSRPPRTLQSRIGGNAHRPPAAAVARPHRQDGRHALDSSLSPAPPRLAHERR
jgi:hypothetical protein